MKPEYSAQSLENAGYKHCKPERALDNGKINCWISEDILTNPPIKGEDKEESEGLEAREETPEAKKKHAINQTVDHYSTVVQMAAYLGDIGFEKVECHHWNDVDVSAELNGKTYAFEYERDRSHSVDALKIKYGNAKEEYDCVFFVCPQTNERKVKQAVGKYNYSTRGFGLKDFIDSLRNGSYFENVK